MILFLAVVAGSLTGSACACAPGCRQESAPAAGAGSEEDVPASAADEAEPTTVSAAPATDGAEPTAAERQDNTGPEPARTVEQQFFSLGSLSPDGADRFLVTFTSRGAAIHRIELNARDGKGGYRYRDLEHRGGFAGKLELTRDNGGLRINVVGRGTPAETAGVRPGDLLVAINGEPVISSADSQRILEGTRIGDEVRFRLLRGEERRPVELTVRMAEQPLELLRPETGGEDPVLRSQASFLFALRHPGKPGKDWPPVDPEMATGQWSGREIEIEGVPGIEFAWRVRDELLAAQGIKGPVEVFKRYWLPPLPETGRQNLNDRTSHIRFQIEIRGGTAEPQDIAWELDGPTGLTTEGWWYQNKIHGSSSSFFGTAGARDVVASTSDHRYRFFGGPEIVSNALRAASYFQTLVDYPARPGDPRPRVRYLGVDGQYFHVALLPVAGPGDPGGTFFNAYAAVMSEQIPKNARLRRLVDCSFLAFDRAQLTASAPIVRDYEIFAGPKEKSLLQAYGLEDNRTFGWFAWMSRFLCWLLRLFYWATGSVSYGIAIVLLTVLVRLCVLPISRKAAMNAQMMQVLAPEMKEIAEKYRDDMQKRADAQRELFQRHRYNPFGGCLLMFLQLPVFIGLYRGLSVDIALRDQPLVPGMRWCSNLAAPDHLLSWESWMPGFLADKTGWLGPWFNVLPMVTIVLFLAQQKLFMPPPTDDQQRMMQRMMTWMMVFMGVMFFKVPSGLCLYFITSSLWGMAERKLLPKPQLPESKLESIRRRSADAGVASEERNGPGPDGAPGQRGIGAALLKRLRDQIEYGEQRPEHPPIDAETKKRLDRERARRRKSIDRDAE